MEMSEEEFIREAKNDWEDDDTVINSIKEALEVSYMNGSYDDVVGDVDSSVGHNYRIDRWIVNTDTQGFTVVTTYDTVKEAEAAFWLLREEYYSYE